MEGYNKNILDNDTKQLPLVSICSITYNHAPFIRQCLDGFLMQKTNFKYEIIIHDDASTDGTAEIIKEYAEKYPDLITPIFQTENQYSKGLRGFYAKFVFPIAKGKYIAMCEGDDYWTDPLKLQKQVNFLESHPDYVMCSHIFSIYHQATKEMANDCTSDIKENTTYDLDNFIRREKWLTHPLTLLFRKNALDMEIYPLYKHSKDITLVFHLLKKGKGVFMPEKMGVYRIHGNGIWSGKDKHMHVKADIDATIGIYDVEKNIHSAKLIRNSIKRFGCLGKTFLQFHYRVYFRALIIIVKELGFYTALKSIVYSFNYFR